MRAQEEICFGRYRLAGPHGPLRAGNEVIALPRKALGVLWALLLRADEVVTKDELLAAVWPAVVVTDGVVAACLRDLRRALGDDPKRPSYIATAHRIGYRFVAEVTRPALPTRPQAPAEAVFVGREFELAQLHAAWRKTLAGQRQVLFVTGEAGIGKTRLVDEFIAQLMSSDALASDPKVVHGQCLEHHGAGEPYLPVLEALGRLCRMRGGHDVVALLRRYAPTWMLQLPGLLDDSSHAALQLRVAGSSVERMQREMVEVLDMLAAIQPLVLVFEDMHWSDPSTVEWLAMLARRREPARLLVIVTCRPVDLILSSHPLKALKHELVARGEGLELLPGYLTHDAVRIYIDQRLPGRPAELATAVYRRSHGHPLFMMHITSDLEWVAPAAQDSYESSPSERLVLPIGLRELIDVQLARLAPEQQAALEAASVAGAEFATASVAAGLRTDVDQVELLLEDLARHAQFIEARGLIQWHDGTVSGHYGFRHDLYRESLYGRLGAARRARLHARIGDRLAQAYAHRVGEIAAELALHFDQAKDSVRSAQFCQKAAEVALSRHAFPETLTHVDKGLALLATSQAAASDRAELPLRLTQGAALLATKGFASRDTEATYLRAQELSVRLRDDGALAPALAGLWNVYLTRAEFASASQVANHFSDLVRVQPDLAVVAHTLQAQPLLFTGDPAGALDLLDRSLDLYDPVQHRLLVFEYGEDPGVVSHQCASLACWMLGYPGRASRHLEQGLGVGHEPAHPFSEAQMLWMGGVISYDAGDIQQLEEITQRLIALCIENDFPVWLVGGRMLRGFVLACQGRLVDALAEADRSLRELRSLMTLTTPFWLAVIARIYAMDGQLDKAVGMLGDATQIAQRTGETWYLAELFRLQGELILQQANSPRLRASKAQSRFESAVDIARRQQARLLELRATASLARLWQRQGRIAAARSLLSANYDWFTEGFGLRDLSDAAALLNELKIAPAPEGRS